MELLEHRAAQKGGKKEGNYIYVPFFRKFTPALGHTQPPIQRISGTLSPGAKRPWREVDHSPPSSVEIKNILSYNSIPPPSPPFLHVVQSDIVTFTFTSLPDNTVAGFGNV